MNGLSMESNLLNAATKPYNPGAALQLVEGREIPPIESVIPATLMFWTEGSNESAAHALNDYDRCMRDGYQRCRAPYSYMLVKWRGIERRYFALGEPLLEKYPDIVQSLPWRSVECGRENGVAVFKRV